MDRQAITRSYIERMLSGESEEPKALPLSVLEDVTNNFADDHEIGHGGFAVVYKGSLGNMTIAIKRLSRSHLHEKEFQREVQCLMKIKHTNIVRFLGYCADTQGNVGMFNGNFVIADVQQRLLCFEYLTNGSLRDHIADASCGLEWRMRYEIIKGITEGLYYLHKNHIVHLDLKPANVLLNEKFVPKIADFGLSRPFREDQLQTVVTTKAGSPGYMAPEVIDGTITKKSDMYGLGVIITEMLTGGKGYTKVENVLENWTNRLDRSEGQKQLEQLRVCAEIAEQCFEFNPAKRPDPRNVIDRLEEVAITYGSAQVLESLNKTPDAGHTTDRLDEMESTEQSTETDGSSSWTTQTICMSSELERILLDESAKPAAISLSLLEDITNNFSDERKIGHGGFAACYKGILWNGAVVVKRLFKTYMYEKEFHREIECLMKVNHKNIVRFLGYCDETTGVSASYDGKFVMPDVQQRLLCFVYLPNGSLANYITDASCGLQWRLRYKIIKEICDGLYYLHQNNIVHLDLTPSSLLLDGNMELKIACFGLSRCLHEDQTTMVSTKIGGTVGYLAPEFRDGVVTYQFDLYSLGVIIMELLTGRKGYQDTENVLESWRPRLEKSQEDSQLEQIRICWETAMECVSYNPAKRPTIRHIVDLLNETESTER